jgi:hypothetical protein
VTDLRDLGLDFTIMPNPSGIGQPVQLMINAENNFDRTEIGVYDILGRQIWSDQVNVFYGNQYVQIPTENMQSGMYLVVVRHDGYATTLKMQVIGR